MFGRGNFGSAFEQGPNKLVQPFQHVHPTIPHPPHFPILSHPSSLQQSYPSTHPPPIGQLVSPIVSSVVLPGHAPLQFPPTHTPHIPQRSHDPSLQGSTFRPVQTDQYLPPHLPIPNVFHIQPAPTHPQSMVPSPLPNQSEHMRVSQLPRLIAPPLCQRPPSYVVPNHPSSTGFFPQSHHALLPTPLSFSDFSFSSLGSLPCPASESPPPPPPPSSPPPEPPSPPSSSPSNLSPTTDMMAISNDDIDHGHHSKKCFVSEQPDHNFLHQVGESENRCAAGSTLEDLSSSDTIDFDVPPPPQKPTCEKLIQRIDDMCQAIVKNGPDFEEITLREVSGNPEFNFMFVSEPGSEEAMVHDYYLWMKRKCLFELKYPQDHENSDIFSPPSEETEISTHATNMNDTEITYRGDSDMDMEDDIVSIEKIMDISITHMKENPDPVFVHNAVNLSEPLHPENNFAIHEEADNMSSDSSSRPRPIEFPENQKGKFFSEGIFTTGKSVPVDRGEEEPEDATKTDQIIVGLENDNFSGPSIEHSSPFRLLQDYESDDSFGDTHTEVDRSVIVVHLNKSDKVISPQKDVEKNVVSDIVSKSPHGTEMETLLLPDSNNILQEVSISLSEAHKYDEGAVNVLVEKITDDLIENHETQKVVEAVDGGDSEMNIAVEDGVKNQTEDDKSVSTSLKVDEFGRLVREGVSESDSDDSYYNRKRVSRGRSWSRSISPKRGNGWRKRVTSPRKRRDRSRSRSLSSKRRREMSGSPINKKFFGAHDDEYKHDRIHVPDCLDFLRGRCYRGSSCRYIHHNAVMSDARRSVITKDMYDGGPRDSEKRDIFPSHGSYSHGKSFYRDECREGRNSQFSEEIRPRHGFLEERKPEENIVELDNFVHNTQPSSMDPHFSNRTDAKVAESRDGEDTQKQPDSFSDFLKSGGHYSNPETVSQPPANADFVPVNVKIGSMDESYQNSTDIFKPPMIPYQECSPEPESAEISEQESDKIYEHTVLGSSITQTESLSLLEKEENQAKKIDENSIKISLSDQPVVFSSHEPSQNMISSAPLACGVVEVGQPLSSEIASSHVIGKERESVSAAATDLIHKAQHFSSAAPLPPPFSRQQDALALLDPPKTEGYITSSSIVTDTFQIVSGQSFSSPQVPQVPFLKQQFHLGFSSAPSPQIPMVLPPPPPLLPPRPPLLLPPPPLLPYGSRPNTVVPSSHVFQHSHESLNNDFVSNPWMPFPGKLTSISAPPDLLPLSRPTIQDDNLVPFHLGDSNVNNLQFGNQLTISSEGPSHPREEFLHFPRPSSTPAGLSVGGSHQHAPFPGDSFGPSVMQNYPPGMDRNESQYPDLLISRFGSRHNPYASTFEQPLNIKFNTIPLRQENELHHGKVGISSGLCTSVDVGAVSGYGSRLIGSSLTSSVVGQVLPDSVGRQYDPLSDSIDPPSNLYGKSVRIPMKESEDEINKNFRSGNSQIPSILEDENNTRYTQAVVPPTITRDSDHGEKEDLEVGIVDDESLSNLNELAKAVIGDIEIDQDIYQGKKKKSKDSKSMKLFKVSLADFVKEILKPSWRQGNMSKEAFKTIVKKTVDKVSGAMKGHHIPRSQAKINQYIESSQRKLTKLVMGYVDKYVKL